MKHSIRINGQVQQFDCELGCVKDKNGVEISEGDIVKTPWGVSTVIFTHVGLYTAGMPVSAFPTGMIEVVGHIAENN